MSKGRLISDHLDQIYADLLSNYIQKKSVEHPSK